VHRWGDFTQRPEEASVGVHIVEEVVEAVGRMAAEYGAPVDAEWVYDGSHVWWVQIRKITGIDDVTVYSRRIAREVLPGMIKPLVWSINVPMVNRAWLDLLEEAVGELGLEAEDLARPFGYRAYFNMTAFGEVFAALGMPRESLELLLGLPAGSEQPRFAPSFATVAKTPRVLRLGMQHRSYAEVVDAGVTRLTAAYRVFDGRDLSELDDAGLLTDIEQMRTIGVEAARMNVVTPLFANAYAALLRRQLRGTSVDATAAMAAAAGPAYDPNPHLDTLAVMMESLGEDERAAIAEGGYDALPSDLKRAFDAFFDEFGHFSDSGNDFSVPPWSETPDVVVEVAAKRAVVDRPTGSTVRGTVPAWRYPLVRLLFRKTTAYGTRRDAVSSMYTYGYGLFRRYFLEVGRRLSDRNILDTPDDVMYLDFAEVVDALNSGGPRQNEVARRRAEMSDLVDVEMPDLIYGDDFVPVQPNPNATVWNGTPTARGSHAGPARIVRGLDDFSKVIDGDVIVIPFSDVGWTPLFAKAGAVVAESGGMLSHSSIVAREYGIPCVVSVNGALRIPDGATVMVDGYGGTVTLDTET
jgi:pyruvate,water dikinase